MSVSRRKITNTDHAFGLINLVCPSGHRIGRLVKQPTGDYIISGSVALRESPDGEHTKVTGSCAKCAAAGKALDLQASWPRMKTLLDEIEADPTRAGERFTIGG